MPELSALEWGAVFAVMAGGAFVQGTVGFGMNVLVAPILVQIEPAVVPAPLIMTGMTISMLVALREHTAILSTQLSWAVAGVIPGAAVGALAVSVVNEDQLAILVGVVVLLAVIVTATSISVKIRPSTLFGAGLASGTMGTATAIGGPPIALLYQHNEGPEVRANLGAFFMVGSAIALVGLGIGGSLGTADVRLAMALVPGVVVGFLASARFRRLADRGAIRPAVLGLSAFAAGVLVLRTVL